MARNPKPTALLEYEKGKLYSDQRDRSELEPRSNGELTPKCPAYFNQEEKRAWRQIRIVLKSYGLFNAANAYQMELLATVWSQYLESCRLLATNTRGMLYISDGTPRGFKENPIIASQRRYRAEINIYSQNLGLSSIGLAKIGSFALKSKRQRDEMEELLD